MVNKQPLKIGSHLGRQLPEAHLADFRHTAVDYPNLPRSHLLRPYSQVGIICLQKEPISGYTSDPLELLLGEEAKQPADPKENHPST